MNDARAIAPADRGAMTHVDVRILDSRIADRHNTRQVAAYRG